MPRHPPCALKNLKATKMLASTVQFSTYDQANHHHPQPKLRAPAAPDQKDQPPTPTRGRARSLRTQQRVSTNPDQHTPSFHTPRKRGPYSSRSAPDRRRRQNTDVPPRATHRETLAHAAGHHAPHKRARVELLRKEVIQPHLPVRLPCYDLVPITSPTFDGSPHKGWATGFGCYRLS